MVESTYVFGHNPPGSTAAPQVLSSAVVRPRRPVATVAGGLLLVLSLLVCGVGGGFLLGPVSRSGQGIELASSIGGKGYSIFDMNEGDDYWIYQPAEQTWSESIQCNIADAPDTWTVRRGERPVTAPEKITHFDTRAGGKSGDYDFTYYGTLRGDRTKAFLSVECGPADFLVVPSRAPLWYLGAVAATGTLLGLVGLAVLVTGLILRRRRRAAVPVAPSATPVRTPGPVPARGPSRRMYMFVVPPVAVALAACLLGGLTGLSLGFAETFDPPDIGTEGKGLVSRVMNTTTEYALYADEKGDIPSRDRCSVREQKTPHVTRWRADRPLGDPETVTYNGTTYRYVGTLRVDAIIIGIVDCGDTSSLLLRPSRRSWPFFWGGVAVATLAVTAAATAGLLVAIRRRRAVTP
ncbi:hypothetical protein GCM10020218_046080 [Dactylosporangium vinaceum]